MTHIALGTAWWGKKENAKAEAAFQEAVDWRPTPPGPALALLEFYAGTGRAKLARETLEEMLAKAKLPEIDRELLRADGLARLGDRKEAKEAYRKAVEAAKEDPAVQMRLAEFLLGSSDPADEAEAEKVLRRIMRQHDPARRRLAEVLVARGGEQEWEEAQKLLEQSAGDPASVVDRFAQARSLTRRGGAENLAKAAGHLPGIARPRPSGRLPGVCLLLAQIRELQDKLEEARKQYRTLVDQEHPAAAQLAAYVAFLLRHGPADGGGPAAQAAREAAAGGPGHGGTAGPLASRPEAHRGDRAAGGRRRPEAPGADRQRQPPAGGPARPGHRRSL